MKNLLPGVVLLLLLTSCSEGLSIRKQQLILIPSGQFFFGSEQGAENETPAISCKVNEFQLSKTEVSNELFEVFVHKTGYVTDAEKHGGFIYDGEWKLIETANWRMPEGKAVNRDQWKVLPVVQVSYNDAVAYCEWADCRLPTEIEWEYAAKLGKSNEVNMNITTAESTSPRPVDVHSYEDNELGILHQSGNVWEWCADVYNSEIHDKRALISTTEPFDVYLGRSFDPEKMDTADTLRVIKGGSFLCQAVHCAGYRPEARQSAEQSAAYFHIGFRVVKDKK